MQVKIYIYIFINKHCVEPHLHLIVLFAFRPVKIDPHKTMKEKMLIYTE